MTPDRITRLEQAVGKLAEQVARMANLIQWDMPPSHAPEYISVMREAAEIARQFSTGEPPAKEEA